MAFDKKGKKCKLDSIVCLHEMCVALRVPDFISV